MKELEQEARKWQNEQNRSGTSLALGLCLGCALRIASDTLYGSNGTGLCFGLCFGLTAGLYFGPIRKSDSPD